MKGNKERAGGGAILFKVTLYSTVQVQPVVHFAAAIDG